MLLRNQASSRCTRIALAAAVLTVSLAVSEVGAQETDDLPAVLVTGTSSGIGLRMTEVLSENGFFVYAGARKAEDLARLDAMENVKAVRLDVTIQSEIDEAVALVEEEGRGLFGLINNAGVAVMGPLIEMPEADLDFQLDVNLFGPYRVTKAFADLLIESEGRVLTTSSIAGIATGPFTGAYSMSKHGVEAYTDALAAEMERFGVAVAVVEPGNYKSRILASMVERMEALGYSAEGSRWGSMRDMITGPLDRSQYDEPDDVAMAALHFLTNESPKRRYMVVPNQFEADLTIRQAFRELAQLNQDHAFSHSREELVEMLDEALTEAPPTAATSADTEASVGLHQAVVEGDLETVRELIEAGSDLNVKEPSGGSSPLLTAATFGRTEAARALIDAGADVNQQNNEGSTALLTAAFMAHAEIVEALLAAGADKSIANMTGSTPLDVVTLPFENLEPIYDYLGAVLGPLGLELDYERIKATRPMIAEMLRQ
ncbi:MAG: SDR family NAD(P)-dependent oxidoreductase [Gemmatimonadetes bacterium]|nr:SDR family NAD(P)-dependent oxidoreductase [Gemmatimonadota bacterium]